MKQRSLHYQNGLFLLEHVERLNVVIWKTCSRRLAYVDPCVCFFFPWYFTGSTSESAVVKGKLYSVYHPCLECLKQNSIRGCSLQWIDAEGRWKKTGGGRYGQIDAWTVETATLPWGTPTPVKYLSNPFTSFRLEFWNWWLFVVLTFFDGIFLCFPHMHLSHSTPKQKSFPPGLGRCFCSLGPRVTNTVCSHEFVSLGRCLWVVPLSSTVIIT